MIAIPISDTAALRLDKANRHASITGYTGSGKTRTAQVLAEGFSRAGVAVFAADVKGDLSGLATEFPVRFWDVFAERGLPVRTSIEEIGPLMLARMLDLNATQTDVLTIAFRWNPWGQAVPLRDVHDLRARLSLMLDFQDEIRSAYGNVAPGTIAVIQRALLTLEVQGGGHLFGEPALDIADFLRTTPDGRGTINLFAAERLMDAPKLYAAFLLWLLSRLFTVLPEVGDLEKPKLAFFFDEAHHLFADAPKALLQSVERLVRLIRSKGVAVFFVTQHPFDIPDSVAAQLGNRIAHGLRGFTPRERRALKAVADGFRPGAGVDVLSTLTELGTGEALVSMLQEDGQPSPVQRVKINAPTSQIAPIADAELDVITRNDPLRARYGLELDRDGQFRALCDRLRSTGHLPPVIEQPAPQEPRPSWWSRVLRTAHEAELR